MLRCDLELSADVILDKISEKRIVLIRHHIVIPYSGADKDLLHTWKRADLFQEVHILDMIGYKVGTRLRHETPPLLTYAVLLLMLACGIAEIRGRTADIVDVPLEVRQCREKARLLKHTFLAA